MFGCSLLWRSSYYEASRRRPSSFYYKYTVYHPTVNKKRTLLMTFYRMYYLERPSPLKLRRYRGGDFSLAIDLTISTSSLTGIGISSPQPLQTARASLSSERSNILVRTLISPLTLLMTISWQFEHAKNTELFIQLPA